MLRKRVGGFKRRAKKIIDGELAVAPELVTILGSLMQARPENLASIAVLDGRIRAAAKRHAIVRLLMTAPAVGPITAMAVVAALTGCFFGCRP
jgi:transposase